MHSDPFILRSTHPAPPPPALHVKKCLLHTMSLMFFLQVGGETLNPNVSNSSMRDDLVVVASRKILQGPKVVWLLGYL